MLVLDFFNLYHSRELIFSLSEILTELVIFSHFQNIIKAMLIWTKGMSQSP